MRSLKSWGLATGGSCRGRTDNINTHSGTKHHMLGQAVHKSARWNSRRLTARIKRIVHPTGLSRSAVVQYSVRRFHLCLSHSKHLICVLVCIDAIFTVAGNRFERRINVLKLSFPRYRGELIRQDCVMLTSSNPLWS